MKASIVDLRYKMKEILKALARNENVTILYHGKVKGIIVPNLIKKVSMVREHPFFGMNKDEESTASMDMKRLRGNRYNDI